MALPAHPVQPEPPGYQVAGVTPIAATPPSVPFVPGGAQVAWTAQPAIVPPPPQYAVPMQARSVVAALTPARPAGGLFWIGMVLLILALVLAVCPAILAFALAVDPGTGEPGSVLPGALTVLCCLFVALFLPGVLMVSAGRPRRSL
jgi:hypothetical protein